MKFPFALKLNSKKYQHNAHLGLTAGGSVKKESIVEGLKLQLL